MRAPSDASTLPDRLRSRFVIAFLVLLGVGLRAASLGLPIIGAHDFRQTQTALGVMEIREHGFEPLHPKLPLFGEPWEVPFEYPFFQLTAALVDVANPWADLDTSIRCTALLYFLLAAFFLFRLCGELFEAESTGTWVLAVFLLSPFNIYWSTAGITDYAAVAFTLAYLAFFAGFAKRGSNRELLAAIAFGCLATLTKIPSVAVVVLPMAVCAVGSLFAQTRLDGAQDSPAEVRQRAWKVGLVALVPPVVGYAYLAFGDVIKAESPYTDWLVADRLGDWYFSAPGQLLDPANHLLIARRIRDQLITQPLLIFALVGVAAWPRVVKPFGRRNFDSAFAASLLISPLLVILVFFNLYKVHDYYLVTVAPVAALVVGAGIDRVYAIRWLRGGVLLLLVLSAVNIGFSEPQKWALGDRPERLRFLETARSHVASDDAVIVVNENWSSFVPYHLRRRAFMLLDRNIEQALDSGFLAKAPFQWIVERAVRGKPLGEVEQHWDRSWEYLVAEGRSPYRLVRVDNGDDAITWRRSILERVASIEGAALEPLRNGAVELRTLTAGAHVSWSVDTPPEPSRFDGLLIDFAVTRPLRAAVRLSGTRAAASRTFEVRLHAGRPNRLFIPADRLEAGDASRRVRVDFDVGGSERVIFADVAFVAFER